MKNIPLYIIFCIAFLSSYAAKAQEPSYTLLGKEELAGIDIYSIIQDEKYNIILATSQGLMRYDGYEYHQYPSHNLNSMSLFGLRKNSKGDIYCFNLRGQILKVEEDSLSIFCAIPDTLLSSDFSMEFNSDDHLVVGGSYPFIVDLNKKITPILLPFDPSPYIGKTKKGKIVFSGVGTDSIYIWSRKSMKGLLYPGKGSGDFYYTYNTKNLYINEVHSYDLSYLEDDRIKKINLESVQESGSISHLTFTGNNGSIWITTRTGGLHAFSKEGKVLFNGHKLYSKYYLSCFLEDKEGNYWFPTLGQGILYISNAELKSYATHPALIDETFSYTTYDKDGNIYLLSGSGKVFQLDKHDKVKLLYHNPLWKFSFLSYHQESHSIFFNNATHVNAYDLHHQKLMEYQRMGIGSIKDIAYFDRDSFMAVASKGIKFYDRNHPSEGGLSISTGRCYRTFFEKENHRFWVLTSKGVELLKNGTLSPFLDDSIPVFANSISGNDSEIWLGTSNKGIYKIQHGKIIQRIGLEEGLSSTRLTKIKLKGDLLFIAHDRGLQIYYIKTGEFQSIRANDGLSSNHILDFDVYENEIFVVTSENIQRIPLNKIRINGTAPFLEMIKVEVNNQRIDLLDYGQFTHLQNQIEFHFKAKAYQHRGELTYRYILKGALSEEWKTVPVSENNVKYLSLSPGKYTFIVKALNEYGVESKTLCYSFTISPPIWATWWFWMICSLSIISLTLFIFWLQIRRIKHKNRQQHELTSSKLAAIKSQMNPHFIFNALNSIQDLILKEDVDNSYSYIVKFSNLVRKTLSYSDLDFIDLEDEINLLSIYLELEKLRIRDNFEYEIIDEVDEEIQIPPMLIQPFVENALKHGLLHKEGKKKLIVRFELSDMLVCTIEDNGIGRVKAQEIKTRQKKQHESFSVGATKTRFDILKKHYKKPLGMEYVDLYDEKNEAVGTKVILRIPFQQIY